MPAEDFTRISGFVNNILSGEPCFQRFDVPNKVLYSEAPRFLGPTQLSANFFATTVLSSKSDLMANQLPPNAPLNAGILYKPTVQAMFDRLEEIGVLVPVNTTLPMSNGATRGAVATPQVAG